MLCMWPPTCVYSRIWHVRWKWRLFDDDVDPFMWSRVRARCYLECIVSDVTFDAGFVSAWWPVSVVGDTMEKIRQAV